VGLHANTAAGALIIDDAESPPYDYDVERVTILSVIWNKTEQAMEAGFVADPFIWIEEINNILVNGYVRPVGSDVSVSESCRLAKINVEPRKMYRLRFVGSSGLSWASFAFDGHENMQIIEMDGAYIQALRDKLHVALRLIGSVQGMQSVWVMGDRGSVAPLPYGMVEQYLTYNSDAYWNSTPDPQVLHYFDEDGS